MSGLNRDRRGLAAAIVGHFQVVSPYQAVVSFGVAEAFEVESGVCHAVLRIQSVDGSCLRLAKDWGIRCMKAGGYYSAGARRYWVSIHDGWVDRNCAADGVVTRCAALLFARGVQEV